MNRLHVTAEIEENLPSASYAWPFSRVTLQLLVSSAAHFHGRPIYNAYQADSPANCIALSWYLTFGRSSRGNFLRLQVTSSCKSLVTQTPFCGCLSHCESARDHLILPPACLIRIKSEKCFVHTPKARQPEMVPRYRSQKIWVRAAFPEVPSTGSSWKFGSMSVL